ncbi:MBL fold metallo-hydrolase [Pelomyxa schiedti]|nr:MBL fold metallo-hydrolase [Pelomyxa schiedti]
MKAACWLAVLMGCLVALNEAAAPFKITLFDVGQADSQLIQFPSGFSILIDCGETAYNYNTNAKAVAAKLKTMLGGTHIDVVIATHMHTDHVGYVGFGGLWWLFEKEGFVTDKLLNRAAGNWVDANKNSVCDYATEIDWIYAGVLSGTIENWQCYVTDPRTKAYPWVEIPQLCSTTQIDPPDATASVTIVAVDGRDALMLDGTPVTADHTQDADPPNENDFSVGIVVRYGAFTYGTFGDLDGSYTSSGYDYVYDDIETVVAPRVGKVDLMKVNHHGSAYSSNQYFIDTLNPQISMISCGYNNSYGHPDQEIVTRLLNSGALYLTEKGNLNDNYGSAVIANSDIVIQSTDGGSTFSVTGGGKTMMFSSRKATPPACAAAPRR